MNCRRSRTAYAFLSPDSKTPFVSGNSLVVIGRDAALVVDTGHVPALARRMIADIKRLTNVPVTVVRSTPYRHFDHVVGNGEHRTAFPQRRDRQHAVDRGAHRGAGSGLRGCHRSAAGERAAGHSSGCSRTASGVTARPCPSKTASSTRRRFAISRRPPRP